MLKTKPIVLKLIDKIVQFNVPLDMKDGFLNYLSLRCYYFCQRWRSALFKTPRVNFLKSDRIGPVQFSIDNHSYANGIQVYGWQPELSVTVGKYCSIAEDVVFLAGGEHDHQAVSTSSVFNTWAPSGRINSKGNILIGNDVWIGHGAIVLSGVHLADGVVVGAGAVVTKSVPPYAIVVGNPARTIKYRFDDETIRRLLESQWWNWEEETLRKNAHLIHDIHRFLKAGENQPSRPTDQHLNP